MTQSSTHLYIHLTWHTEQNRRLLTGDLETFVHDKLHDWAAEMDLAPLAVNSAWDHVHGLYRWHPSVAVAEAVRRLKSKTSIKWNQTIRNGDREGPLLSWQSGYGAVSVRHGDVETVRTYIDEQKQRHQRDQTWAPFEKTDDDGKEPGDRAA